MKDKRYKFYMLQYLYMLSFLVVFVAAGSVAGVVYEKYKEMLVTDVFLASAAACVCLKCICHVKKLKKRMITELNQKNLEQRSLEQIQEILIKQSTEAIDREVAATIANTRAEISALQSQINPHFLYNTLDTIRGQALIDETPVIADMAEALSHIFRYSISSTGQLVTLQDELRNIDKYIMIQSFRFENKFSMDIKIEEDELVRYYIPKLTLQPIVENAIYHGLEIKKNGGLIKIYAYATKKHLVIQISDNGVGMTSQQLTHVNHSLRYQYTVIKSHGKRHIGVALSNIQQRIRLLFGEEYGLAIQSAPNQGTQVDFILPLITDPENYTHRFKEDP